MTRAHFEYVNLLLRAALVCALMASTSGQFEEVLREAEKQSLLDYHNYQRASVQASDMRRMVRGKRL